MLESLDFRKSLLKDKNDNLKKELSKNQEYIEFLLIENEKIIKSINDNIILINQSDKKILNER